MRYVSYNVAALLASATALSDIQTSHQNRDVAPAGQVFNFKDISPSSTLQWIPCYNRFHCANLEVPLDYDQPSLGSTVVAWIRLDSANGTGTDVLFNPGGPGGSGVNYMLSGGGDYLMNQTGGSFNIVSFDPRGVNASGIDLTCFPNDTKTRDQFSIGTYPRRDMLEEERYAEAVAYGRWCSAANSNTHVRYAGTMAVVQDMVHFAELQAANNGDKQPDEALIHYYGVSYGTIIGQTLAALFPDRIGRIIVDGNVNSQQYYTGATITTIEDADASVRYFLKLCYEAGERKCVFASNSSSVEELEKRFDALLGRLEKEPLQLLDAGLQYPEIITKTAVLRQIWNLLFNPSRLFVFMAQGLDALERRNATRWHEIERTLAENVDPSPFNYTAAAYTEAQILVGAIDAAGQYPFRNVDEYTKAVDDMEQISHWAGTGYAKLIATQNSGMTIIPPKSQVFPGFNKTKTKNPILFLNNNADPITPLASAKHMSTLFEGSVVLTQNSGGHSSSGVRSSCTTRYVIEYLVNGTLPKNGTICQTDKKPLVDATTE